MKRQSDRAELIGERVRRGLSKKSAKSVGRQPRYIFSGLLKCGQCGSNYVIAGAKHCACAAYVNGKACVNSVRVRGNLIEEALLQGIRIGLLSTDSVREACRRVRSRPIQRASSEISGRRIPEVEDEVANLPEALAKGALRASHALSGQLIAAETQLADLKARAANVPASCTENRLPDIANRDRRLVRNLARSLQRADADHARIEPGRLGETEIRLCNEQGRLEAALLRAVGWEATASFFGSGGLLPIQATLYSLRLR